MNRLIKYIPLIILFLLSLKSIGQVVPKETIVDEVYGKFIDSTFTSYYLMEDCAALKLTADDLTQIKTHLKSVIPPGPLEEIISKAAVDTLPLKWNAAALAKVIKCLGPTEANTILGKQFADSSEVKKKEAEDEKKSWVGKTRMGKTIYTFSRPIFDKKGQYALIRMKWEEGIINQSTWSSKSKSCICVLKSIKGHWRFIQELNCTP